MALGALFATGVGSIPTGQADTSAIDQLKARRAQLVAQLAAMDPARNSASSALGAAEAAYADAQSKVDNAQAQLTTLNNNLVALSQQEQTDEATSAAAKRQLAQLTRATYEGTGNDGMVSAILSSDSFAQAMDRLHGENQIAAQVIALQQQLAAQEQQITQEKTQIQTDRTKVQSLEDQLSQDQQRLLALVADRSAAFNAVNGPARAIEQQIADIDNQIAADEAPPPAHYGGGPCGNRFAYGYCTWYVATRRCIPWLGNAKDWYANAAAMGFKEGHQPAPGAVVVFPPGGDGAGSYGHVGYVEVVGPADGVPAGSFKLSEMNFTAGWDRVDYRVLPNNSGGIEGFIYGQ